MVAGPGLRLLGAPQLPSSVLKSGHKAGITVDGNYAQRRLWLGDNGLIFVTQACAPLGLPATRLAEIICNPVLMAALLHQFIGKSSNFFSKVINSANHCCS